MTCPTCEQEMELRPNQFYWRGKCFTGYVCADCNSLWTNEADSMFKYITQSSLQPSDNEKKE